MDKVVFFGSIGIARRILDEIVLRRDVELLGVCCEPVLNQWREEESVYQYAMGNGIPVLALDEIPSLHPDLGISARFNRLIRPDVINAFRLGIVNTHGGILPEYRGSYCNINAVINGESKYGVTLHYIAPGVDDGDVIDTLCVDVTDTCTGMDLYRVSEQLCYLLVDRNIDELLEGTNRRMSQKALIESGHKCGIYKRDMTMRLKDLTDLDMDDPRFVRIIRAFDSPFHEPAYRIIHGEKIYLRYRYGDRQ